MKSKIFLILVVLPLNLFCQSNRPEVLASSGGSGDNAEFSMSWTLGEVFMNEFSNGNLILTQGFHQGGFSSTATSINDPLSILEITAFPNPVSDVLRIHIQNDQSDLLFKIEAYDILGAKIIDEYVKENIHEINFSSLAAGTYLVRVSSNNYHKIFHIIKNDSSHEKN